MGLLAREGFLVTYVYFLLLYCCQVAGCHKGKTVSYPYLMAFTLAVSWTQEILITNLMSDYHYISCTLSLSYIRWQAVARVRWCHTRTSWLSYLCSTTWSYSSKYTRWRQKEALSLSSQKVTDVMLLFFSHPALICCNLRPSVFTFLLLFS